MNKILLVGLCSAFMFSNVGVVEAASVKATGFFGEVMAGGFHGGHKVWTKSQNGSDDDYTEIAEFTKNGFNIGAGIGYGYEFNCGFYTGVRFAFSFDILKDKEKLDKATGEIASLKYDTYKMTNVYGFGVYIEPGFKVAQNFLVHAIVGFEMNNSKFDWALKDDKGDFAFGKIPTLSFNQTAKKVIVNQVAGVGNANDADYVAPVVEVAIDAGEKAVRFTGATDTLSHMTTSSLVLGGGVRYSLTPYVYIGVTGTVAAYTMKKEIDRKYINTLRTVGSGDDLAKVEGQQVVGYKVNLLNNLKLSRPVSARYGLTLGVKF